MSNDVSGNSTSVETSKNLRTQVEVSTEQSPSDETKTATARVPVEVVVHGIDDEPSLDPAQEVAMLLGEAPKTTAPKVEIESPTEVTTEPLSEESTAKKEAKPIAQFKAEIKSKPPAAAQTETVAETKSEVITEPKADDAGAFDINPFEEMGLSSGVMSAIKTAGYETPSPIQSETVPHILSGRDVMGQAETGSGKTAAFAWPLLSKIDLKLTKPQVLVLAPTRELAIQVTAAFEKYGRGLNGFRAVTIYGGQSYETQLRALNRGVQVVVGTPGRVMDHLRRNTLDLRNLKTLVLDEADEMLRMGFIDDVEWILEQTPKHRQILSFSATLPEPIQRIAKKYLNEPANISIKSRTATADSIDQSCLFLHAREKMERLVRILQTEETDGVIVFVKTRNTTVMVSENLVQRGIIASALNGDIPQNQRERTVNQLKSGRINVVVATDVAARGLDVKRISHVINYDFPHDTEAYVHRIGRTGRAGRTGNAILFVEPKEKGKLSRLQRATNQRIDQFKQKSIDEINRVRVENFKQKIVAATEDKQIKFFSNLVSELQNESEIPFADLAGALAVLAQGDTPLLLKELAAAKSNWRKERDKKNTGRGNDRRDRGPMTTYRVEVGRSHGVGPGNIVGAVTNEADLSNADIGRINIFDQFSTIDLPTDIPQDLIEHLKNVNVQGQRLGISKSNETYAKSGGRKSAPSHGGGRYDKGRSGGNKFGGKKYGDKKYSNKKSYDKPAAERGSYSKPERKFDKDFDSSKASEKKPYKKSTKGKSNASGERTEQGEKRDRYNREGENRYASRSRSTGSAAGRGRIKGPRNASAGTSKHSGAKPAKPRTPKTKAAARTQAKRKPNAKASSPMKKYVKIRSAK